MQNTMYLYDELALPKVPHPTARSAASNGTAEVLMSQEGRPLHNSIPDGTPDVHCCGLIQRASLDSLNQLQLDLFP